MWKLYYAPNLILYVEQQTSESLMLLCQYGNTLEVLKNLNFDVHLEMKTFIQTSLGKLFGML